MLDCDWFKNCHDNAAKVKPKNFSSRKRRQILLLMSNIVGKTFIAM